MNAPWPGPSVGAVFGGLRIDGVAGRGGMGVVYRATQLALERTVAVKVVDPGLASDPVFRDRFRREARLAAVLDHPHVVPVHHAGEADGYLYLTMRYVDGTDLASELQRSGPMPPWAAVELIEQIAGALDAAHASGLVHRDVKPANILLTRSDGRRHAYLTDFGISKDLADTGRTLSDGVMGSLNWIAPEQLAGDPVDGRADVYALGCVLFQCLTGRVPFSRDRQAALMYAHLHTPAPLVGEVVADLRGPLDPVVATALAKRPVDRYLSAGDFARAARAALDMMTRGVVENSPRLSGATPDTPTGPRRRSRWLAGVLALLAVLVVGAVILVVATRGSPASGPDLTAGSTLAPSGTVTGRPVPVGVAPVSVVAGGGYLWTADTDGVTRVDPATGATMHFAVPGRPGAIAYGGNRLWVWNYSSTVVWVDPRTGVVSDLIRTDLDIGTIVASDSSVWFTVPTRGLVGRIDAAAGTFTGTTPVGGRPDSLALRGGKLYVLDRTGSAVVTIDEASRAVVGGRVPVPPGTDQITVESGTLYIGGNGGFAAVPEGSDGPEAVPAQSLVRPGCPCGFVGGEQSIWLFDTTTGTVTRLARDLRTPLGAPVSGLGNDLVGAVIADRKLWFLDRTAGTLVAVTPAGPL